MDDNPPYTIQFKEKYAYADLAAERILAAERTGEKTVVEIKSFLGYSLLQDFKEMLGQISCTGHSSQKQLLSTSYSLP